MPSTPSTPETSGQAPVVELVETRNQTSNFHTMFSIQNYQTKGIVRLFVLFPFMILMLCSFIVVGNNSTGVFGHGIKTPDQAIAELKYGNNRFLDKLPINTNYQDQIEATKDGQHPHSFVLGCIDSRVPPEIIFDQGIGDLFVSRVAGNVEDDHILGSMEFATKIKHTKLIVVLGHSHCGAVNGAMSNVKLEHLTQLVDQIKPSINTHETYPLPDYMEDQTSRKNVKMTIHRILQKSNTLREQVENKEIKIVGAYYDVASGEVIFL